MPYAADERGASEEPDAIRRDIDATWQHLERTSDALCERVDTAVRSVRGWVTLMTVVAVMTAAVGLTSISFRRWRHHRG